MNDDSLLPKLSDDSNSGNLVRPRRPDSHITGEEARIILEGRRSRNWIVRPVAPPDVGIDLDIEWTEHGNVMGAHAGIQLKGTDSILWNTGQSFAYSKIEPSTNNYFLDYDLPVFLILSDVSDCRAYFCPAKEYIRANYERALSNQSISYRFFKGQEVGENNGIPFALAFLKERRLMARDVILRELPRFQLAFHSLHYDFYRRDEHMTVDDLKRERELLNLVLDCDRYSSLFELPFVFGPKREQVETWRAKGVYPGEMLERDFTEWLDRIDIALAAVVAAAQTLVGTTEKVFWQVRRPDVAEAVLGLNPSLAQVLTPEARRSQRRPSAF
jgi:Domain of unknown function (DUF4365)